MDPFATFRSLPREFHQAYYDWHSSGQYEGSREFNCLEDVLDHPPSRERDDHYEDEFAVIDRYYRPLAESRVLEVACGDGNLTYKLAKRAKSVVARDIDPVAIEVTRKRLEVMGLADKVTLENRASDVVDNPEAGSYDVVLFVQVLEHVPHWEQGPMFDRIFDLVAPGGCLFISTPNRWVIRDAHDTGKLFIHWLPRWLRVPLAKKLGWGIPGHDPSWPYPPVLHDYVSYRWMLRRARKACPGVSSSQVAYYPTLDTWFAAKRARATRAGKRLAYRAAWGLGHVLPLNYYLGEKVIFAKPALRPA